MSAPTISAIREEHLDCTEIARRVRADLKKVYPGVAFSVRSSRYAGGSSVHVNWTDGPCTRSVDAIASRYEYRHFDGMDDSTSFSEDLILRNGELVRQTGSSFVQSQRRHSDAAFEAILEPLCVRYGIDYTGPRTMNRYVLFDGRSADQPLPGGEYLHTIAYRIFSRTDYTTGKIACNYHNELNCADCAENPGC